MGDLGKMPDDRCMLKGKRLLRPSIVAPSPTANDRNSHPESENLTPIGSQNSLRLLILHQPSDDTTEETSTPQPAHFVCRHSTDAAVRQH